MLRLMVTDKPSQEVTGDYRCPGVTGFINMRKEFQMFKNVTAEMPDVMPDNDRVVAPPGSRNGSN